MKKDLQHVFEVFVVRDARIRLDPHPFKILAKIPGETPGTSYALLVCFCELRMISPKFNARIPIVTAPP